MIRASRFVRSLSEIAQHAAPTTIAVTTAIAAIATQPATASTGIAAAVPAVFHESTNACLTMTPYAGWVP